MTITGPAIRYHGSKFRLASWIMQFFPEHKTYVEPFGGGAAVLLQKRRSYAEVYNDLDSQVVNFFRVIRNAETRRQLIESIVMTPYARIEFDDAIEPSDNPIESARRLAVRAMMGFSSAGATKKSTGFRIDTKRPYSTAQHIWRDYPESIAAAGIRLSGVLIENATAISIMAQHDAPDTLHFVDPPYLHSTRSMKGNDQCYRHEMTESDHIYLLKSVILLRGPVVICGYPSALYSDTLAGWECHSTLSRTSSQRGSVMRTECVWINDACADALHRNVFRVFERRAGPSAGRMALRDMPGVGSR